MVNRQGLTEIETAALAFAAEHFGRCWKQEVRHCWEVADYPSSFDGEVAGALQRLRNSQDFGPRGLIRYRVGK